MDPISLMTATTLVGATAVVPEGHAVEFVVLVEWMIIGCISVAWPIARFLVWIDERGFLYDGIIWMIDRCTGAVEDED